MPGMIAARRRALSLGWLALLLTGGSAGGHAQECGPTAIRDAFRQGEAAYAAKDFSAAAAQFRPLAEQGLGPAQLRLGEIIAAGPGKPDLMEAYRWIALAADADAPGAKP